jgi:hypothetical protein
VELRLERAAFTAAALENLLRACPKLEKLVYVADGTTWWEHFLPGDLQDMIVACAPNLRSLELDLSKSEEALDGTYWLRSLAGLASLEELTLGVECLGFGDPDAELTSTLLVHLLPASLLSLRLTNVTAAVLPFLENLAEAVPLRFPSLKSVSIQGTGVEDVVSAFAACAVGFEMEPEVDNSTVRDEEEGNEGRDDKPESVEEEGNEERDDK